MKKTFLMTLSLVLVVGLVVGCGCKKKDDSKKGNKEKQPVVKTNTEPEVIKDREVDGIKLTNSSVITTDGVTDITTSVTNPTSEDYHLDEFKIIVKDKNGDVMITLPGYVGDVIKAGETRTIRSSVSMDLSNAKSIEYEVAK